MLRAASQFLLNREKMMAENNQITFDAEIFGEDVDQNENEAFMRVINEIKSRDRKYIQILSILKFDWPQSKEVIEKLSSHLTEDITDGSEPIIYQIIEKALSNYSQMVFYPEDKKYDDVQRIGTFIETLIVESCTALKINMPCVKKALENSDKKTLSVLIDGQRGNKEIFDDEESIYELLYKLIASEPVKTIFARMKNENTPVASCVAVRH